MAKKPKTTWYVEPIGEASNRSISELLQTTDDDYCWETKVIINKKERIANLIRCPNYNSIVLMTKNKLKSNELKFRIFSRKGFYGKIRETPYLEDLNKHRPIKTRQKTAKALASRQ